jgi:hypothetical protein
VVIGDNHLSAGSVSSGNGLMFGDAGITSEDESRPFGQDAPEGRQFDAV